MHPGGVRGGGGNTIIGQARMLQEGWVERNQLTELSLLVGMGKVGVHGK